MQGRQQEGAGGSKDGRARRGRRVQSCGTRVGWSGLEGTKRESHGRGSAHTLSTHNRKVGSHSVMGRLG
jgi:hypothetical protein